VELALWGAWKGFVQPLRDHVSERGITQELEPLVVCGALAAVGQGEIEQSHVLETVVQRALERLMPGNGGILPDLAGRRRGKGSLELESPIEGEHESML
jgi:hypothetical protein